ncbi:MAG TPA: hypothetical protein VLA71_06255 [Algoriphagus sp.]|nr:hypothetical protein [Algoriphagus sp.]
MQLFSSPRNRDRAKWFFVILLGMAVIHLARHFEVLPTIWQFLRAMSHGRFFFLG